MPLVELLVGDRLVATRSCRSLGEALGWLSAIAARLTPGSAGQVRFRISAGAREVISATGACPGSTPATASGGTHEDIR